MKDDKVKRFTLRIDKDLFEALKKDAKENKRAIGAEITYRLSKMYEATYREERKK